MAEHSFPSAQHRTDSTAEKLLRQCPACHQPESRPLCRKNGYDIVTCVECGCDYVTNPPDAKALQDYYGREAWFEGGEHGGYQNYDAQTQDSVDAIRDLLMQISNVLPDQKGSLLDVGCGYGSHLQVAADLGWRCFGVELSEHARSVAIERLGDAATLVADTAELIPHPFDVILMLDVIEHVSDPYKIFYQLFALGAIQPHTRVIISTPNAGSLEALSDPAQWTYRHPPSHLTYFTKNSLQSFFQALRFTSIQIQGQHLLSSSTADEDPGIEHFAGLFLQASGTDFQAFMQERYVPSTWSEIAEYEHFPRYELARCFAAGLQVLDFGCGTGYGTAMLASVANRALGVDIDASALDWARRSHRASNLTFQRNGDFLADFEPHQFDLITCFEMIEHVGESDQEKTIQALAKVLRPEGLLLISTPNPEITSLYGSNPYHLRERTRDEFLDLLKRVFRSVRLVDQYALAGVFFVADDQFSHLQALHGGSLGAGKPLAYVAMCSHGPLPPLHNQGYLDIERDYIAGRLNQERKIMELRLVAYQGAQLLRARRLQDQAAERDRHMPKQTYRAALATLGRQLEEWLQQFTELTHQTSDQGLEVDSWRLRAVAAEQAREALEQTHRAAVADLEQRLETREHEFGDLSRRIAELEQELHRLQLHSQAEQATNLLEQTHRATVAALEQQLEARLRQIGELAHHAAELERELNLERKARWSRLGQRLRTSGVHRTLPVRGGVAFLRAIRRRAKRPISSPFKSGVPLPLELESSDEAYRVRQPQPVSDSRPVVLHAIANFCLGGSSRLVVDLLESLGDGFDQVVVTRYVPSPPAYVNLTIYEYGYPLDASPFETLIRHHKPDFVHIHYWGDCDQDWYDLVFHACEKHGVRVIQNINTPVAPYRSVAISRNVYVSDFVRQTYGQTDGLSMVIHPGSDLEHFSVSEQIVPADDCIGMVYRLESDKLNASSIDVFIKVAQRRPQTRCLIVGDGSLRPVFEKAVGVAGVQNNFVFTGYVPYQDLPSYYRKMSVFVAPVWKESFGQVSSFAMNMYLPVVGFAVGAIPTIVGDDTLLAQYGDSDGLADCIVALLDDRQRRLAIGHRNHEKAQAEYSVEAMVNGYRQLYASMCNGELP